MPFNIPSLSSNNSSANNDTLKVTKMKYCEVCLISCAISNFEEHLNGKKHRKILSQKAILNGIIHLSNLFDKK